MRILAAFVAIGCVALSAASPASAHSDEGIMTAEGLPGPDSLTARVRARVVFANDGHPAGEATVTVTGTGPGGAQLAASTLPRVDNGEYETVVSLPAVGEWSLQFNSTNPAATAAAAYAVSAPQPGTPPTSQAGRAGAADDDSAGISAAVIAIVAAVVVAALVAGFVVVRRRR